MYECDMCARDVAHAHVFNGNVLCGACAIHQLCGKTKQLSRCE